MSINPTASEQYLLELVNWARAHPEAQASRLGIGLNEQLAAGTITPAAKQPLVFNEFLINAARAHSQWMIDTDTFSHTGVNGSSPSDRMAGAGYVFTPPFANGENISFLGSSQALDPIASILASHNQLFVSPPHRTNLMNGDFKEIGLGAPLGAFTQDGTTYNSMLVTENFAFTGSASYLTGVVIDDLDLNHFYTVGEGRGGATVTATGTGGTFSTTTWDAGGYRLEVPAGSYTVNFTYDGKTFSTQANVGSENVKVDAEIGQFGSTPSVPIMGTPGSEPITGTEDVDRIIASAGNDTINGLGGTDTVVYAGARAVFNPHFQGSAIVVDKPGGDADTLTSIERVDFDDGHLIFDLSSGNAPAAYRLYGGAFDRTPDEGGLRFWTNAWLDTGRTLHDAAAGFIDSAEFVAKYGAGISDAAFVDQLYQNVLHRPGEQAGVDFWNGYLAQHTGDRADVLVNFTQLPEFVGTSAANIDTGLWVV